VVSTTDIVAALEAAWRRVRPILAGDQHDLARRIARRRRPTLRRPPRAWCIALRANDHRLHTLSPPHPLTHSPPQLLDITRPLLMTLANPVRQAGGGYDLAHAAEMLGRSAMGLLIPRIRGTIRTDHMPACRRKPRPLLATDHDQYLDPNAKTLAPADEAWAWTGQNLAHRLPPDFSQTLTRIPIYHDRTRAYVDKSNLHPEHPLRDPIPRKQPRYRLPPPKPDNVWYKWKGDEFVGYDWRAAEKNPQVRIDYERHQRELAKERAGQKRRRREHPPPSKSQGSLEFRGWLWLCPVCGKTCRTIYLPAPPINLLHDVPRLARMIDVPPILPLPVRERAGVRGTPVDTDDPRARERLRAQVFACRRCHQVKFFSRLSSEAWNDVVAYLSQGLLYGREVQRPTWFTKDRKRAYAPRPTAAPSRRLPQVAELLLQGLTHAQIAAKLGLRERTIDDYTMKIYVRENVHSVRELARKLKRPDPTPPTKQEQVRRLLDTGLSYREIAARLGLTHKAVQHHGAAVRRQQRAAVPRLIPL
jgi:DNA-binding NarL/FixJ family response regulator